MTVPGELSDSSSNIRELIMAKTKRHLLIIKRRQKVGSLITSSCLPKDLANVVTSYCSVSVQDEKDIHWAKSPLNLRQMYLNIKDKGFFSNKQIARSATFVSTALCGGYLAKRFLESGH